MKLNTVIYGNYMQIIKRLASSENVKMYFWIVIGCNAFGGETSGRREFLVSEMFIELGNHDAKFILNFWKEKNACRIYD